ncbi:uncharacterized protein LOC134273433 [Saccostrea cucullata]|uniref:uncharacterized protein LOC134273433 n=1 Tax=Saccostrea cuccullata TaxID=36930 RepID=UPI002ED4AA51
MKIMGSGASTTTERSSPAVQDDRNISRALSLRHFHGVIKTTLAELHRLYLNPTGKVSDVLNDLTHPESYELELLISGCSTSEAKSISSQLEYAVENIIYEVTGIMPPKGLLGTSYKSSGIYELIREGNTFPDGYFLQCELERLHFDDNMRTVNVGDGEAFMLLIGMFITRGLITTLLLKPVEYRLLSLERYTGLAESNLRVLATTLLYIVRQVSVIRGKRSMPIPLELQRFLFSDEEMRPVYGRLTKTINYGERYLKDWGIEYIKRLRISQQYEVQYR